MRILFFTSLICIVSLLSMGVFTHSFFMSSATSQNNLFSTAGQFGTPTPTISPTATPTISPTPIEGLANHVVISEIQTATSGATASDFVEFYNPTLVSVSLNNFKLQKRTQLGTESTLKTFGSLDIIPARGYYLWATSDGGYNNQLHSDVSTAGNIADNNSIALEDSSANIVDAIAWGNSLVNPFIEVAALANLEDGKSYERKAYSTSTASSMIGSDASKGNGFDSNNNANDFILRSTSEPQNSASGTEIP